MTPLGATIDVGGCDIEGDGVMTCGFGAFESGATRTITASARAVASGSRVVFAEVISDAEDNDQTNNTATVETTVAAGAVTLVVTNTNDRGPGSLRQAIIDANTNVGTIDTIQFQIGTGVQTISPPAGAPALTLPIVVVAEMRAERLAR